jgi:hypothetical protein
LCIPQLIIDLRTRLRPLRLRMGIGFGVIPRRIQSPVRSPAMAGLILTAKSIARYPEFKREQFAEYFLVGTLLSISAAIVGGIILLKIFYRSPVSPQ